MSVQTDKSQDVFRYEHHPLDAIFKPRSVAVIGATDRPESVGRAILANLLKSPFGGTVYPVNLKRSAVLGVKAYPNIAAIEEQVDLAVVVVPAKITPQIIRECVDAGIRGAIIISAGFKETGESGAAMEREILRIARQGKMRIVGPNCLGVMNPTNGLNATFAANIANAGNVGFISQSGAFCTSVLDWSYRENVGFSAFVSIGSMLDVGWGDLIDYLGNDPHTRSIVIYMESVGNARRFMSAAREVALTKPIIIIKPGRTAAAAQAAASHTGSMTGSDAVLQAAFRRVGALRVDSIADLFAMSEVLAKQPAPAGKRLTIVTNAGGPGVLSTDALIAGGGELADLSPELTADLNEILPAHWSHNNPIDILGDAGTDTYQKVTELVINEPNNDGILVILTPQAMSDPTAVAEAVVAATVKNKRKPVLASWMGGDQIFEGEARLNQGNIPTFDYPDTAVRMFNYMWRYRRNLDSLYETPRLPDGGEDEAPDRPLVDKIIATARQEGRTILTEFESKRIFAAYHIPTVPTKIAKCEDQAVELATEIGYPAVLKLHSGTITHKTDVDGVQLDLADEAAVRAAWGRIEQGAAAYIASRNTQPSDQDFLGVTVQPMVNLDGYELILGSSPDPQFGPTLLFGAGGTLVEVFHDTALGLPPLNSTLARRMMRRTKIYKALGGVRGRASIDMPALENLLVHFSQLVVEQPLIKEIDINPLLASPHRIIALDARIVLYPSEVDVAQIKGPAIRPYPSQYARPWTLRNGEEVNIRPIRPEDEPLIVQFHKGVSEESVYMRYFSDLRFEQRTAHERLTRICFIDYDREMALVVTRPGEKAGVREIVAAGRMSTIPGMSEAEFSLLIRDDHQRQGIGTELLTRLLDWARNEGIRWVVAYILPENMGMKRICQKLGFDLSYEDRMLYARIDLQTDQK